jgi:hypothetical protein
MFFLANHRPFKQGLLARIPTGYEPAHAGPVGQNFSPGLGLPSAGWRVPLKGVFGRADADVIARITVSRLHRESSVAHESLRILQRVVDQRHRAEERTQRTILVHKYDDVRPGVTTAETEAMVKQSPRGLRVGMPGMAQVGSPPAIDIEKLTDQVVRHIDRRIVAHRERMGRVF